MSVTHTFSLHATSMPYFEEITRVKQSADPQASSKDKILLTEALGLVMVDHGGYLKGTFGEQHLGAHFSHFP